MSIQISIAKVVNDLKEKATLLNPDSKHNTGRTIGEAFFWDEVAALAKKQSDLCWAQLTEIGITVDRDTITPGDHSLATTPHFTVMCKASNPRKAFNVDELATRLKRSKYKVPEPVTKELVEAAKLPTKPTITYVIAPRA